MATKRVFLLGFMGCGKSTVGKALAEALKWQFIDMDTYIENKAGVTVSQIFSSLGEEAFRKMEKETLEEIAQLHNIIVATGGGAPCFHNNMEFMNSNGLTIYLKLNPEGLRARLISARQQRPLIADKTGQELLQFIKLKLAEREPFYNTANIIADATTIGPIPYIEMIKLFDSNNATNTSSPKNCGK